MADFNADPNPMPEIKLGIAELVCGCIGRFAMLPTQSEPCLSEHHREPVDDSQGQLEL
jgi:hypothetical protein